MAGRLRVWSEVHLGTNRRSWGGCVGHSVFALPRDIRESRMSLAEAFPCIQCQAGNSGHPGSWGLGGERDTASHAPHPRTPTPFWSWVRAASLPYMSPAVSLCNRDRQRFYFDKRVSWLAFHHCERRDTGPEKIRIKTQQWRWHATLRELAELCAC